MINRILLVFQINKSFLTENIATWTLYGAAIFAAIMPILQGIAFILAACASTLTVMKILKDFFKK